MIRAFARLSKVKAARKAQADALARKADAEARGDTRDLGKAQAALRDTMTALLKAEVVRVKR